jgi:hypothetical protein
LVFRTWYLAVNLQGQCCAAPFGRSSCLTSFLLAVAAEHDQGARGQNIKIPSTKY